MRGHITIFANASPSLQPDIQSRKCPTGNLKMKTILKSFPKCNTSKVDFGLDPSSAVCLGYLRLKWEVLYKSPTSGCLLLSKKTTPETHRHTHQDLTGDWKTPPPHLNPVASGSLWILSHDQTSTDIYICNTGKCTYTYTLYVHSHVFPYRYTNAHPFTKTHILSSYIVFEDDWWPNLPQTSQCIDTQNPSMK